VSATMQSAKVPWRSDEPCEPPAAAPATVWSSRMGSDAMHRDRAASALTSALTVSPGCTTATLASTRMTRFISDSVSSATPPLASPSPLQLLCAPTGVTYITAMKKLRIVILGFDTARQKRESLNDG
jgi:hypothetical protein